MTKLEEAAKALWEMECSSKLVPCNGPVRWARWDQLSPAERGVVANCVRAVLQSIREPSDDMLRAGLFASVSSGDIWRAIVDALLVEKPK